MRAHLVPGRSALSSVGTASRRSSMPPLSGSANRADTAADDGDSFLTSSRATTSLQHQSSELMNPREQPPRHSTASARRPKQPNNLIRPRKSMSPSCSTGSSHNCSETAANSCVSCRHSSHGSGGRRGALVDDAGADLELLRRHAALHDGAADVRARVQHVAGPDAEAVHVESQTAQSLAVSVRAGRGRLTRTQRAGTIMRGERGRSPSKH